MKNRGINDINQFKSRIKKLYEYKIHDLTPNQMEEIYHVNEDDNNQTQEKTPVQQNPEPKPIQQPEPTQQPVQPTPTPVPVEDKNENEIMSFLKSELQKLDNVVSSIENISLSVDEVSKRLDTLTKIVDEVREPSDIEKLEMRAFDSYPYSKTLTKVWDDKRKSKEEQEMERLGIQKNGNEFQMEYSPQRNFNHVQSSNNINNF